MKRTWTKTGEKVIPQDSRDKVIKAIESLKWQEAIPGTKMAAMPGMLINNAIKEFGIPKVSHVATSNEMAPYGFVGIRSHYKNGQAEIYLIDRGSDALVVCSDFHG